MAVKAEEKLAMSRGASGSAAPVAPHRMPRSVFPYQCRCPHVQPQVPRVL